MIHFWMIMHLSKLDVLYDPILDESEVTQNWMFCTIHFGMILSMFANHPKVEVYIIHFWMILSTLANRPKVEVLYNPLLDDF